MNQPLLTVLMPVYNAEKYVAEAINSILTQTLADFEFIIIDDGSVDDSLLIVRSYQDSRVRVVQNERNMGISATLNKGIQLSSTELIARMDADDISYPDRLQRQYQYMMANPDCALLSAWVRVVTEDKQVAYFDRFNTDYQYYNLPFISPMYHPTVMYRRSAVLTVGGYTQRYAEDYALFWKLSRHYKIHNIEQVLLDYRITTQSLHQVQHKEEYEEAHLEQALRNIHYYTGETFQITPNQLASLCHFFEPLLLENSVHGIIKCVQLLDDITQKILTKDNVNRDPKAIVQAACYKREFILAYYVHHLSRGKAVSLLIQTGSWRFLYRVIKQMLRTRIKG